MRLMTVFKRACPILGLSVLFLVLGVVPFLIQCLVRLLGRLLAAPNAPSTVMTVCECPTPKEEIESSICECSTRPDYESWFRAPSQIDINEFFDWGPYDSMTRQK
jgi:hypothetical protein